MKGALLKEIFHRCSETYEEDFEHVHHADFGGKKKKANRFIISITIDNHLTHKCSATKNGTERIRGFIKMIDIGL